MQSGIAASLAFRRLVSPTLLLGTLTVASLGACGGGDDSGKDNGIAAKSPRQVVSDVASSLARVRSFHLDGTMAVDGKRTKVVADVEQPNRFHLTLKQQASSVEMIVVGSAAFIKANAAFWEQQRSGAGSVLAGKWIKAPQSTRELRDLTRDLSTEKLSRCLLEDHGTLGDGGKASVGGQSAVVVVDKGDRPGTAPGKLYVAATGEPLPLRVLTTGRERPGGNRGDECSDPDSKSSPGDQLTFSRYNEDLDVKAPAQAIDPTGRDAS